MRIQPWNTLRQQRLSWALREALNCFSSGDYRQEELKKDSLEMFLTGSLTLSQQKSPQKHISLIFTEGKVSFMTFNLNIWIKLNELNQYRTHAKITFTKVKWLISKWHTQSHIILTDFRKRHKSKLTFYHVNISRKYHLSLTSACVNLLTQNGFLNHFWLHAVTSLTYKLISILLLFMFVSFIQNTKANWANGWIYHMTWLHQLKGITTPRMSTARVYYKSFQSSPPSKKANCLVLY